ncbi:MAG TPA: metalloregulator ArsR/SmtB family transcription factor [Terracidiphilus sp.]|nr:metalloregulator ArsR/SmtB family transcription factor [Terracidiphilus sp.]
MASIAKILRAAADPSRLRILLLLRAEELSVAELQEILGMGQSTISTHLSQLRQAGLVEDRRAGKGSLYRLTAETRHGALSALLGRAESEMDEAAADLAAMDRVVKKRQDRMRAFFDSVAGRLGPDYVPGKSWKSLAEAFLRLMPPMVIADLGAGNGSFALLLSQRARQVIAIDSSEKMLEVGRAQAQACGMANVDFRLGDMEELPIDSESVDLACFSQSLHHAAHPQRAVREAHRILRPGGRILILDLARHRFEQARELYADEWLGFAEAEIEAMLATSHFVRAEVGIVDKAPEATQFQTLLATAEKPMPEPVPAVP